jgi:hypothetical protein
MKTSNQKCRQYVQALQEFQGNNLFSTHVNNHFVVYSYGLHFPLFINSNGIWYENSDRYSVTTSKHRSQSHPLTYTITATTQELQAIINN